MTQTWRKVPPMSHEKWLEWRQFGIGASDSPAIMGVSPWNTPYQAWEKKVTPTVQVDNPSMQRGRDLEHLARDTFIQWCDTFVYPENAESEEFPWIRASLDGISTDGQVLVEIKCPNKIDHKCALDGKVPEKYYPQCQHQLLVTGLSSMWYYSFDGKNGVSVRVERDNSYINEQLFPKLKEFWSCVLTQTPPPLSDKDRERREVEQEWLDFLKRGSLQLNV